MPIIRSKKSRISPQKSPSEEDNNPPSAPPAPPSTTTALSQTLAITANLANHLPTGTLLAFQLLIPSFTSNGSCDSATRTMTLLLLLLRSSAFLACFTDCFQLSENRVIYDLATSSAMWIFDPLSDLAYLLDLAKYKVRIIDCLHGALSVLIFVAAALRDKNMVQCFYPSWEMKTKEVLDILPLGIGVICSLLFVVFPTNTYGIGYSVTNSGYRSYGSGFRLWGDF